MQTEQLFIISQLRCYNQTRNVPNFQLFIDTLSDPVLILSCRIKFQSQFALFYFFFLTLSQSGLRIVIVLFVSLFVHPTYFLVYTVNVVKEECDELWFAHTVSGCGKEIHKV